MIRAAIFLLAAVGLLLVMWTINLQKNDADSETLSEESGPDTNLTVNSKFTCPVHGCALEKTYAILPRPYSEDQFDPDIVAERYPLGGYLGVNLNWNQDETEIYRCDKCVSAMMKTYPLLTFELSREEILRSRSTQEPLPTVVIHADGILSSTARARLTFSRISAAGIVHTNGFPS